jgi:hypothetical protein
VALTRPSPARAGLTRPAGERRRFLVGGGTDGNEELTAIGGSLLLVLLAVLGITIIRVGQLLWLHLFLGLLLIGPVVLKLASTGYRFVRYYSGSPPYRRKGPPHPLLRGVAPALVISTLAVFVTGVLLLLEGPGSRGQLLLWHKVSFFVWLAATVPHVLGHLVELPGSVRATGRDTNGLGSSAGAAGRWIAVSSALVAGLVLAIVLLPDFGAWTSAHFHHHHG